MESSDVAGPDRDLVCTQNAFLYLHLERCPLERNFVTRVLRIEAVAMNGKTWNPAIIRQKLEDLSQEFAEFKDELRAYREEVQEVKGMSRDLHQIFLSHERICSEMAKVQEQRATTAAEQRERIEKKIDSFITASDQKESTIVKSVIAILVAALAFFVIPFFTRT